LRALVDAVRTSRDGEFVTVQNRDSDVRVAKRNGTLFVHVFEKNKPRRSEVEVKVPMKVVDALFSGDKMSWIWSPDSARFLLREIRN